MFLLSAAENAEQEDAKGWVRQALAFHAVRPALAKAASANDKTAAKSVSDSARAAWWLRWMLANSRSRPAWTSRWPAPTAGALANRCGARSTDARRRRSCRRRHGTGSPAFAAETDASRTCRRKILPRLDLGNATALNSTNRGIS